MYFVRDISELHCVFCTCPKDIWEPLDSYQSDRSCEFYNDVTNEANKLDDRYGYVSFHRLYKACMKYQKEYPDIPNFWEAIKEIMDTYEDLGIYEIK